MRRILLLSAVVLSSGCYHATVETGRAPSGQVVENQWAHGFIAGLVPPSTVSTAAECPQGVARVSTQLSVLNMLANILTFGIYSPMTIRAECAAPGAALNTENTIELHSGATKADLQRALGAAAERSRDHGADVFVTFRHLAE
jgi:hypothetical protein